jgi:hypothetical protein
LLHIHEDKEGNPLNIGRKTRTIPPAIRRALKRRDGGCRFPGCSNTRLIDAHHIHHWADGGETSMDNLVLLCKRHHRLVHEEGYGIEKDNTKNARIGIYFTLPDGKRLANAGRSRGNVIELKRRNADKGLDITPDTPIPRWYGDRMDVNLVMHGLQWADRHGNQGPD